MPASAANGVFTLDTATEMFVLHSGQAVPAGGGLVQAAGRMWVAAAAESDPRAISMEAGGSGLNAGALAKAYLLTPEVCCMCVVWACVRGGVFLEWVWGRGGCFVSRTVWSVVS